MSFIREYFIMFIILYVINYLILIGSKKRFKKNRSISLLYYLKKVYSISISKDTYGKFIWLFALINTFIIDTSYIVIIYLLNNLILRFVFGIIILILLTVICYGIFARLFLMKEGNKNV